MTPMLSSAPSGADASVPCSVVLVNVVCLEGATFLLYQSRGFLGSRRVLCYFGIAAGALVYILVQVHDAYTALFNMQFVYGFYSYILLYSQHIPASHVQP